jgi:hypothetical protein
MVAHWLANDNNCVLTVMEKQIRYNLYGTIPDPEDCFTYNLIAPVYDFKKNNADMSGFIYVITISLWLFTLYRLYSNYMNGKLSKIEDFMIY